MPEQYKRQFYEKTHRDDWDQIKPHGILGYLFLRLRRFEKSRGEAVFELLPYGEKLLDVGCGDGSLVWRALEKFEEVYGIDIALSAVCKAQIKINTNHMGLAKTYLMLANLDLQAPFKEASFDATNCVAVLEHLFDPYHVISEFHRLLRKEGILIINVPNTAWLPYRLSLLFGKLPITSTHHCRGSWDAGHLHYFTFEALTKLLEEQGFQVVQRSGSGVFAEYRRWWLPLLSADIILKAVKR